MGGKTDANMEQIYMRRAQNLKQLNIDLVAMGEKPIAFSKMKSYFNNRSKSYYKEVFDDE